MAIAKKYRRKITVGDSQYFWLIEENRDWVGMILHVVSEDKHFVAKYQLGQSPGEEYIVVLGRRFAGANTGATWKRFFCPRFDTDSVTPRNVRQLIEWCLDESLERRETSWVLGGI